MSCSKLTFQANSWEAKLKKNEHFCLAESLCKTFSEWMSVCVCVCVCVCVYVCVCRNCINSTNSFAGKGLTGPFTKRHACKGTCTHIHILHLHTYFPPSSLQHLHMSLKKKKLKQIKYTGNLFADWMHYIEILWYLFAKYIKQLWQTFMGGHNSWSNNG